jgi:hypothetical protein
MKTHGGVNAYIHVFLISALVRGEQSASRTGRFNPEEREFGTHWIRGWVGLGSGMDDMKELQFLTPPPPTSSWHNVWLVKHRDNFIVPLGGSGRDLIRQDSWFKSSIFPIKI